MSARKIDDNPFNRTMRKSRLAAVLAIVAVAVIVPVVLAHAKLVRSEPANNAILVDPPHEARLWFSETISSQFSGAQMFDIHGRPVEVTGIRVEPAENLMILTLPDLAPGLYSVRWRVLSEADGHFTQGFLVFGLGEGIDPGAAVVTEPETAVPLLEALLRWFNFSALLTRPGFAGRNWSAVVAGRHLVGDITGGCLNWERCLAITQPDSLGPAVAGPAGDFMRRNGSYILALSSHRSTGEQRSRGTEV
jgi:copper transport protein